MKSVKRVFTKSLPRYNLRSRKSAVPVARNSTPKVNREVQASLSEEENCTLSFELPFHPSSLPPTAHVTSSSEEIEPIQSSGLPRFSTAFSEQNPANRTNTEAIDISIDPCEGPSIVQQSLPEPTTSFVPRRESDASPSEDFIPQQSSQSHHGPRTDLEVEETSDSEVDESLERRFFQLINSPADFDALVRKSINYTEPKQTAPQRRFRCESSSSDSTEEEGSEDSAAYSEELSADERSKDNEPQMDRELIETLGKIAQRLGSKDINISKFYGYDREDIDQWLEEFDYQLEARDISPESKAALTQLTIHIAGPAQEYIRTLPADQRATLGLVKDALKRCYSHRNREWVQRQQIAQRRQKPTEPLGDYVSDVVSKLHKLDMQENTRVYHFIEGLKPELQMEVLKAKPKTLSEAVETAREFDALLVRGNKSTPSEHTTEQGLINKLGELVSKLAGNSGTSTSIGKQPNPEHPIVARMESLITRAENTPHHSESQESRNLLREIREIKQSLMGEIQELDRRVDARINGLARRNQNSREEPLRQRTREGRPICYSCGRVGHVQQNCNQRSPREPNQNFEWYQPNYQRRQERGNYPPRSGYNQPQLRDDSPSRNPRSSHLAAIDSQGHENDEMAPLGQNHHTFPQGKHEFLGMDSGEDDAQTGEELYQQYQNGSGFYPATARYDEVAENKLTSALLPALKNQLSVCQQTVEDAYANDGIYGNTSADHSENDLLEGLVTKTDADIATRPLGPTKTLKAEKKKPDSKKKCQPNKLISFPGAVRRAQKTIETNTSPSMNPENEVKNGSSPDPSPPQISTSAGCEPESVISVPDPFLPPLRTSAGCEPEPVTSVADPSVPPQLSTSAGYEENLPPSGPVPDEIPCESIEATADQCNVTSDEPRPRDSMVTAQLNQKDAGLLVDTRANMSALDEQSTRDLFDGKLLRLQKTPPDCQLSDSEEEVRCFEDSDNLSSYPVPHTFPDTDFRMFAMQEQINELGMKLNGIAKSIEPKQEVSYKWRKYSFKTKPVCYRCGRRGHIQYYCNYNQSNDGFQKERQVLHRATRPNYTQPEESSTYEEENQSAVEGTASQLESQENATNNPDLLQKMKPTRTSNRIRKPRNPNQKPRKLQIPNQSKVQLPLVNEADTYPRNLITKGKIAGKPVRLMLDTGASVSAIKEEVLKEIYGDVPFSTVQTGKDNLQLRRITLPLYLKESQFPCEFQVVQNLTYDAILGRDFLQVNRAMIDLDNNTITLKESENQQEPASSASAPLTGTFKPQEKNVRRNGHAPPSEGSVQPAAGDLPSRYPKNKEVVISQSLLILVLIAVSLSATFHTDANGNFRSVIQKPPPSFAQVSQKKVWHQGDLSNTPAKTDYRMESNEGFDQYKEAPPGMEMPKFMMHLRRLLILRPMTDFSNK